MNRDQYRKVIFWTLTLLHAGLIFYFSSQGGNKSMDTSGFLAEPLARWLMQVFGIESSQYSEFLLQVQHLIRKTAHFLEYAVLGVWVVGLLDSYGIHRRILLSVIVCGLYAATDEWHQSVVSERTAQMTDVLLDTVGAAAGSVLGFYLWRYSRLRRNRDTEQNELKEKGNG